MIDNTNKHDPLFQNIENAKNKLTKIENQIKCLHEEFDSLNEQLQFRLVDSDNQNLFINANNKKIHKLAYYDVLTDLPNRTLFEEYAIDYFNTEKNPSGILVFIGLDNFKNINDTFGHSFGDKILKAVGLMLNAFKKDNDFICRFGGDEFVLFLKGFYTNLQIQDLVKRITKSINRPLVIDEREVYVAASIGITRFPEDGCNANLLIKNAETAMNWSKTKTNTYFEFYNLDMEKAISNRLALETTLRKAVEREEFVVYYQPQIDITTQKIIGVEALVRWNHPTKGIIPPDTFIPIAEETGLIIQIGEFVMRKACMQLVEWHNMGYKDLHVSINLSAKQFYLSNLKPMILGILEETKLEPHFLDLEITETVSINDINSVIRTLNELIDIGINISLDDFGTGYSSLNYLKQLPLNTIKIDKSFVSCIVDNKHEKIIAETIIDLAHKMDLTVTAEGVETLEQFKFLVDQKCDKVQGFLFSKPVPPLEVVNLMEAQLKKSQEQQGK